MAATHVILSHWRRHRPTMMRELEESGELDQLLEELAEHVLNTRADLIDSGMSWDQASELTDEMWRLPDEDDPSRGRTYDVAADGRFLMVKFADEAGASTLRPEIKVVLNWERELLERVPVN